MRVRPWNEGAALLGAVAVLLPAAAPAPAWAAEYLSVQEAPKALFPAADRFEPKIISLTPAQMQALQARYGVDARSAQWKVLQAWEGGKALGWVVIDNVVGKFELITYAVGIKPDGSVAGVEILAYRESHGGEVRLPAWRQQFVGKNAHADLQVGEDIANISGATLSCTHVTQGIKRIVSVLDLARASGLL